MATTEVARQSNVAIGGDPEHQAFQIGAEHGREDMAKQQHGDPRASYESWLDYMAKQEKMQSWMYQPESKLQYLYGYDSVRHEPWAAQGESDHE